MLRLIRRVDDAWLPTVATVVVFGLVIAVGLAIRLRDLAHINLSLAQVQGELVRTQRGLVDQDALLMTRIEALEKEIFGVVTPKTLPQPVIIDGGPQAWQRNRDRELRRRLEALEQWRLEMMQTPK